MSDQNPGDEQLSNHIPVGIIIGHYKNPYEPTSQMACHKGFERCSYGPNSTCHREIWKALRFKKEREARSDQNSRELSDLVLG